MSSLTLDWSAILDNEAWRLSQATWAAAVQADPVRWEQTAASLKEWAQIAPTLPQGALLGVAQAGIDPHSPTGDWLIRSAVPSINVTRSYGEGRAPAGVEALNLMSNPSLLNSIQSLPVDQQTQFLKDHSATELSRHFEPNQTVQSTEDLTKPYQGGGGWLQDVGGALSGGARWIGAGLMSGAELVSSEAKTLTAETFKEISNVRHGNAPAEGIGWSGGPTDKTQYDLHIPNPLHHVPDFRPGMFKTSTPAEIHSEFKFGGAKELSDPGQITIVQALKGKSLGTGIFPGGPAHEAAVQAQQRAATVNGHALTPGRALAAFVTQPGSVPYSILSGAVDFQVALKGDPGVHLINEMTSVVKGARIFSATSDEAYNEAARAIAEVGTQGDKTAAVRAWTGRSIEDMNDLQTAVEQKLREDPSSLRQLLDSGVIDKKDMARAVLAPKVGLASGLRNFVHPENGLQWVNSERADEMANRISKMGFTQIRRYMGKTVPPEFIALLHDADTPEAVKSVLAQGISTEMKFRPRTGRFGYDWNPFGTRRFAGMMPNDAVSHYDIDGAVTQAERTLQSISVPRSEWDDVLVPIAKAGGQPGAFRDAYVNGLGGKVAASLEDTHGLDRDAARKLVTFWSDRAFFDRLTWTDEVGNTPWVSGISADGEAIPLVGPTLGAELTDSIPKLDARALRRAASKWGRLYNLVESENRAARGVGGSMLIGEWAAGLYTDFFKEQALARLGLPVRILADAQASMAIGHMNFANDLEPIGWVIGHRGDVNLLGDRWETANKTMSQFQKAISQASWVNENGGQPAWDAMKQFSKHADLVPRGDKRYLATWSDRLALHHADPLARELARATLDPEHIPAGMERGGLDGVKDWFEHGAGNTMEGGRQDLINAKLWQGQSANLVHRSAADAYIEKVALSRLMQVTGGDETLLKAIAEGEGISKAGPDLQNEVLPALRSAGVGPDQVLGRKVITRGRAQLYRHAVDRFFSAIVDAPYRTLAKSPAFKQGYWRESNRLLPMMDAESQAKAIANAAEAGLTLRKPAFAEGIIDLEGADRLAKIRGLKAARDLLHYTSERNNFMDTMRVAFPFGDAWRNVVNRWAKTLAQNPVVFRRGQQIQQGTQAWFFNDPRDNEEKFTVIPPGLTQAATGVPWRLAAPIKGLNIASEGLPGAGPVLQVGAMHVLPRIPATESLRNWMFKYGEPDYTRSGGLLESLLPGWVDKIKTSGWFGTDTPILNQTGDQSRILKNTAEDAFAYFASTGTTNMSDPAAVQALWEKSMGAAQRLYLLRSAVQFVAPAAPDFVKTARLKNGQLIELYRLAQEYHGMIDAHQGDTRAATLEFMQTFGPDLIYATQSHTSNPYGVPTTEGGVLFDLAHPGVRSKYKNVARYWETNSGAFDYNAYLGGLHSGDIKSPTGEDWIKLANARMGNAAYASIRQRFPTSMSDEQSRYMNHVKDVLVDKFPGFDEDSLKASYNTLPQNVRELKRAIRDPYLSKTPLAHAITVYLDLRDAMLEKQVAAGGSASHSLSSGKRYAALRDFLFTAGDEIATRMPVFTPIWQDLFMFEVQPPSETANP